MFERAKSLSHVNGRPAASLSSGLLARKGQAAPAMRPQLGGGFVSSFGADLGWNDMGHDAPPPAPAPSPVAALHEELRERIAEVPVPTPVVEEPVAEAPVVSVAVPQPAVSAPVAEPVAEAPVAAPEPTEIAPAAEAAVVAPSDVPVRGPAPRILRPAAAPAVAAPTRPRRAAFTLRLDADRHRKLRVAALLGHRSCQQLVTEALDQFLATHPDVAEWADRLSRDDAPQS